jgi:leucyl-tRNA synthetase
MAEEMWARKGRRYSIHQQKWPQFDAALAADEMITLPVQINGRLRDRLEFPAGASEAEIKQGALSAQNVLRHLAGATPRQVIYVPGRLVNIVV